MPLQWFLMILADSSTAPGAYFGHFAHYTEADWPLHVPPLRDTACDDACSFHDSLAQLHPCILSMPMAHNNTPLDPDPSLPPATPTPHHPPTQLIWRVLMRWRILPLSLLWMINLLTPSLLILPLFLAAESRPDPGL